MKQRMKLLAVLILSSFLMFSCSEDDSNPVDDNGNNATLKGRVTDNSGYGNGLQKVSGSIEGATVTTAQIQSNGSLQTTSEQSVMTDANGEYEIEVDAQSSSNLVVVATKGTNEWKAMVSSEINTQQENHCPPLNSETTSEVDVYSEVIASGNSNTVSYADVAYYVDAGVAANIKSNATTKTEVMTAIKTELEARANATTGSYYGYSNTQYEEAKTVDEEAQKSFEMDLYLSSDTEASYNAAWKSYFNSRVNGYSNTSITMSHYAEIQEISGKAMMEFSGSLDSETRFQLEKQNAYLKAKLIAEAMIREYDKAGADEQEKQKVAEENDNLLLSIRSSTSAGAIDQAYANYRTAISAHIKTSWSSMIAAFTAIDSTIEASVKNALEIAVDAAVSMQGLLTAYTTFYGSVEATVNSELSISDNAQLEAFTNIYALIYMHN